MPNDIQSTKVDDLQRKNYLLRVAARYIRENCPEDLIEYDGAECDGSCLAEDCEFAAEL